MKRFIALTLCLALCLMLFGCSQSGESGGSDKTTAAQLERYLKSGSGRAFANKHLFPPAFAQRS